MQRQTVAPQTVWAPAGDGRLTIPLPRRGDRRALRCTDRRIPNARSPASPNVIKPVRNSTFDHEGNARETRPTRHRDFAAVTQCNVRAGYEGNPSLDWSYERWICTRNPLNADTCVANVARARGVPPPCARQRRRAWRLHPWRCCTQRPGATRNGGAVEMVNDTGDGSVTLGGLVTNGEGRELAPRPGGRHWHAGCQPRPGWP